MYSKRLVYGSNEELETKTALWTALSFIKGLSPAKLSQTALESELDPQIIWENIVRFKQEHPEKEIVLPSLDKVRKFIDKQRASCRLVTPSHEEYSDDLLSLDIIPLVLYVKGSADINIKNGLAIAGSRNADAYGQSAALDLSRRLAEFGLVIVSGLAKGIDACAHKGALEGGGTTIAVMGCGIDICYPSENLGLRRRISESGAIISEYPGSSPPLPYKFPHRNRLIAALSRGTMIVQASYKSGAMITADAAAALGRQVMAVPGQIGNTLSEGPLQLISEGAALIRSAQDVLDSLGIFADQTEFDFAGKKDLNLSETERIILEALEEHPMSTGSIIDVTGLSSGTAAVSLNGMELKGLIRRLDGLCWAKVMKR